MLIWPRCLIALRECFFPPLVPSLGSYLGVRKRDGEEGRGLLIQWHRFDTIADLMFGEPLGLCEDMEYSPWLSQLFTSIWLAGSSRALQYFPLLFKLVTLCIPKSIQEAIDSSFNHTVTRVDKRLAMQTDRPDMLGLMLKHKDENATMSMAELYANADLLMIAGTETTATSLSGLLWHLLNAPEALRRLTAEIREAFGSIEDITMESLPRLPVSCLSSPGGEDDGLG